MRRRLALLLVAVVAATTLTLLGPARPASAVIVCGGNGTAFITPGLLFPVLLGVFGPAKDHTIDVLIGGINIVHTVGWLLAPSACVHVRVPPTVGPLGGFGFLKGYCGQASGFGTLAGEQFAFVHVGTLLLFTGHFAGVGNMLPTSLLTTTGHCLHLDGPLTTNPFALPGGTTTIDFQLAGVGLNCFHALPTSETLVPVAPFLVLPTPTFGVHVHTGVHLFTMPQCGNPSLLP